MISTGSFFKRNSAPLLGIDVSSSSVKLVELERDKTGHYSLVRCAIEPLEMGWIVDGNFEKFDEIAHALRRLIKKSGARTRNIAMALPASAVIAKKIILPMGMSDLELEAQVESEANQFIPFDLDEVCLDFCVIGESGASSGELDVLIAASRKERVQALQDLAEVAGLKPVIVDVDSYASRLAAGRLIQTSQQLGLSNKSLVALFELGSHAISMQVIRNGEMIYEREQTFGGAQLTQQIVRQYGFTLEEAEQKKCNDELPEDYESLVLRPFVRNMAQEINRALLFFFSSTPNTRVDQILLGGGSASLKGLPEAVNELSHFPVVVADPFAGMTNTMTSASVNRLKREAPTYLTACGLALRRFLK